MAAQHGLSACPVCKDKRQNALFAVEAAPIHPFSPPSELGIKPGFGALGIVECGGCGHVYNAAFDENRVDDLYAASVLTNTPVSESMVKGLEETAAYILARAPANPLVADVGGGTGVLSRSLARRAQHVHLVEPSRALDPRDFDGTGVTLHQAMFPAPSLGDTMFDVIVSRQVIEHIPDPLSFLVAIRSRLRDGGIAYIETPSQEYIETTHSIVDFHYPHVQYYRKPIITALFEAAGFRVLDVLEIKNGHDRGFLLEAAQPKALEPARLTTVVGLAERLATRRALGEERLKAFAGKPIALYGANAYSQALLGLYPELTKNVRHMFDDTPMYEGQRAYGTGIEIPIMRPTAEALAEVEAVIVTSYLHDVVISRKVRAFGFTGPIFTVRSDDLAGQGDTPPGLFA